MRVSVSSRVLIGVAAFAMLGQIGPDPASRRQLVESNSLPSFGALVQLGLSQSADLLRDGQDRGDSREITAALRAQSLFVAVRDDYDALSRTPYRELGNHERKLFNTLRGITQQLTLHGDMSRISGLPQLDSIYAALPHARFHPGISGVEPPYLIPGGARYRIKLTGSFTYRARPQMPELSTSGRRWTATEITDSSMTFTVPSEVLTRGAQAGISRREVVVTIPWTDERWFQPARFRTVGTSTYALDLAQLPQSAGTLTINADRPYTIRRRTPSAAAPVDTSAAGTHRTRLEWAEAVTYSLPPGAWRIRIALFDGREFTLDRAEIQNDFVSVRVTGRDVTVSTYGAPAG